VRVVSQGGRHRSFTCPAIYADLVPPATLEPFRDALQEAEVRG
jgi:hypothetical protein